MPARAEPVAGNLGDHVIGLDVDLVAVTGQALQTGGQWGLGRVGGTAQLDTVLDRIASQQPVDRIPSQPVPEGLPVATIGAGRLSLTGQPEPGTPPETRRQDQFSTVHNPVQGRELTREGPGASAAHVLLGEGVAERREGLSAG